MKARIKLEGKIRTTFPDLYTFDEGHEFEFTILYDDETIVDLEDVIVFFKMKKINSESLTASVECTNSMTLDGVCFYTVDESHTAESGVFDAELEVQTQTQVQTISLGRFRIIDDLINEAP
jgi:hypothetical protein